MNMGIPQSNSPLGSTPRPDPRLAPLLAGYPADVFDARLHESIGLAETYTLHLAVDVLQRLGARPRLREPRRAAELAADLGVVAGFVPALSWLLGRLAAAGILLAAPAAPAAAGGARYQSAGPWPDPQTAALRRRMAAIDGRNLAALDLLDAAAAAYPAIATGSMTGEQALLSPEAIPLWLAYFSNRNPLYAVHNRVSAGDAARLLPVRPGDGGLCLLELGAGAGSSTEALLQELDGRGLLGRVERLLATEPGALFRRRAQRALVGRYPGLALEFAALDIDRPWSGQGVAPASCALVFAVNVLHVAKDLRFSLGQALASLAPGGWLIAGECLRPPSGQVHMELVFQVLGSFTDVATDAVLRPRPGFLAAEEWHQALAAAGFHDVQILPDVAAIQRLLPAFCVGSVCGRRP